MADVFKCSLVTPEEKVLEADVTYASIPAWDGQVGIAPGRAPLLVKLGIGVLRLDFPQGGQHNYLIIESGFAQMVGNHLTILASRATPAENLVEGDAGQELKDALEIKAVSDDEVEARDSAQRAARERLRLAKLAKQGI